MRSGTGKACREVVPQDTAKALSAAQGAPAEGLCPAPLVPLSRAFYERPVLRVARECVGKLLVYAAEELLVGRIVEVEAYRGPEDRAAHSYGGRRTPRTEVMFGPAGYAYVFVLYGLHYNLNLVTGAPGQPQAVLIRAVEPILGAATMALRRNVRPDHKVLTNGPGKVCQAFGISKRHYGVDLTQGSLFLCDGKSTRVARSPRIGVDYAGSWANKPWRFFELGNMYVSHARRSTP